MAETYRNISAVGAKPLAITNCLNFANPQRPEIMAQIVECLRGMTDACLALDYPIVSGNVSLYNESKATGGGSAILPTPAIGGVGLMDDHTKMATIAFKAEDEAIYLVWGQDGTLGQSLWLREILCREAGDAPATDLGVERRNGEFVRDAINRGLVSAVHDVSDGGALVALSEMAMAGNIGATLDDSYEHSTASLFGESQGNYLVTIDDSAFDEFINLADARGVEVLPLGNTRGTAIRCPGAHGQGFEIPLTALREASDSFFRDWMDG